MCRRYNLIMVLVAISAGLFAQSNLEPLLVSIQTNNKTIRAEQSRIEASKANFQLGLSLYDPELSFDFMRGFPTSAGNQTDLTATQGFDFPTAYKHRRRVANLKTGQINFEGERFRKDILLEAKLVAFQLVYLNKRKNLLAKRQESSKRFLADYQKKLNQGEATILELNKAKLQLLNVQTDLQLVEAAILENLEHLTEMNGGNPVFFADTIYPPAPDLPDFETLERTIETTDPTLKQLETQQEIGETETRLTKAMSLPKMEAGYHYQGILGQQFHGVHLGLSLPLWENKKQLNHSELQTQFYGAQIEEHRIEHFHEIKRLFEQYQNLRQSLETYQTSLQGAGNDVLLEKALQAGQITVLEYFMETSLFYASMDRFLELEAAWHRTGAELMKFQL